MIQWAEISAFPEKLRYQTLSAALTSAGFPNEVSFIESDDAGFDRVLEEAQAKYAQLRIGDSLGHCIERTANRKSSVMHALRIADAYVQTSVDGAPVRAAEKSGIAGVSWWPKNYLVEGIQQAVVSDIESLDLSGAVFVLGAGAQSRSAVAALTKIGFGRFSISDPDEALGRSFIEEARATFFSNQFQLVPRHLITQLPSVHSVAVNTMVRGRDQGAIAELFYFNFLKAGGLWLDLPFVPNRDLDSEATAVGASAEPGYRVAAWTDRAWARETLGVNLELEALVSAYEKASSPTEPAPAST